jgi:hypothetical protein
MLIQPSDIPDMSLHHRIMEIQMLKAHWIKW